jgi:DNA-binding transcriptional LysR family regulator
MLDQACAAAGYRPRVAVRTEQATSAANFAAAGLGPTLIPANVIPPHFDGLVLRPDPPVQRRLCAYTRTLPDALATAFVDMIADDALVTPPHIPRRLRLSAGS